MGRPRKNVNEVKIQEDIQKVVDTTDTEVTTRPDMDSTDWTDWVLGQLRESEKDGEDNPTNSGLRRLVRTLLGEIIECVTRIVDSPNEGNNYRAVAENYTVIAWNNNKNDLRKFGDVGDCGVHNTIAEYARFAPQTAGTRSESRTFKKALNLVKVYSADEVTSLPISEAGFENQITTTQENAINIMCRRLDIDAVKYINSGSTTYPHFRLMPYKSAQIAIQKLNNFQQNTDLIPEELKGYKEGWIRDAGKN